MPSNRVPVRARKVPIWPSKRGRKKLAPASGNIPIPASGMAKMVFSVAIRKGAWTEMPRAAPTVMYMYWVLNTFQISRHITTGAYAHAHSWTQHMEFSWLIYNESSRILLDKNSMHLDLFAWPEGAHLLNQNQLMLCANCTHAYRLVPRTSSPAQNSFFPAPFMIINLQLSDCSHAFSKPTKRCQKQVWIYLLLLPERVPEAAGICF